MKHSQERTLREMTQDAEFHARQRENVMEHAKARIMRDALETIAHWDINLPMDTREAAIRLALIVDAMQALALTALTGKKR